SHSYPRLRIVTDQFSGWPREFSAKKLTDLATQAAMASYDLDPAADETKWIVDCADKPMELASRLVEVGFLVPKNGREAPPDESLGCEMLPKIADPYFAIRPVYCPGLAVVNT